MRLVTRNRFALKLLILVIQRMIVEVLSILGVLSSELRNTSFKKVTVVPISMSRVPQA